MSVSLSVCWHIFSKTTYPNLTKFSVCVTSSPGSILLYNGNVIRYKYTVYTSSFVDDVMFLHNGANGAEPKSTHMFRWVRQVALLGATLLSTIACLFVNYNTKLTTSVDGVCLQ